MRVFAVLAGLLAAGTRAAAALAAAPWRLDLLAAAPECLLAAAGGGAAFLPRAAAGAFARALLATAALGAAWDVVVVLVCRRIAPQNATTLQAWLSDPVYAGTFLWPIWRARRALRDAGLPGRTAFAQIAVRLAAAPAAAIAVLWLWVAVPVVRISGPSMAPALHDGDFVCVLRLGAAPARGDIVLAAVGGKWAVKRVVGLAGDAIDWRGGRPFRNGSPADGAWRLAPAGRPSGADRPPPVTVPPGHLYLLGDNRDASDDSRRWGPVPDTAIVGRVLFRWSTLQRWPF